MHRRKTITLARAIAGSVSAAGALAENAQPAVQLAQATPAPKANDAEQNRPKATDQAQSHS